MRLTITLFSLAVLITSSCASALTESLNNSVKDTIATAKAICSTKTVIPVKVIPYVPPVEYKDYLIPIKKVEQKFINARSKFYTDPNAKGQYIYEIYPVTQYPFWCLPGRVEPNPLYVPIYSDKSNSIYYYKDRFSMEHIQVGILQYVKTGIKYPPRLKNYYLYAMQLNYATKMWEEEKAPALVTLVWSIDNQQYFIKK